MDPSLFSFLCGYMFRAVYLEQERGEGILGYSRALFLSNEAYGLDSFKGGSIG